MYLNETLKLRNKLKLKRKEKNECENIFFWGVKNYDYFQLEKRIDLYLHRSSFILNIYLTIL